MSLFDDEPVKQAPRRGADWETHRQHRHAQAGPPSDEVGVLALSSFVLARTSEVVVAVRGITAYSDGLHLSAVVLFADETRTEDLAYSLQEYSRSPGRFRFGVAFSDGRQGTSGIRDSPDVERHANAVHLTLLNSAHTPMQWNGDYWLHPVPPAGPLVVGCRWPDRAIPETLVQIDPAPLITASATSRPVWEIAE
ncbi:MAG: hypothetical protein ABIO67_06145 [Mycobacteriales bacterium]